MQPVMNGEFVCQGLIEVYNQSGRARRVLGPAIAKLLIPNVTVSP